MRNIHPLLLKLNLRWQLPMGRVTLLRGLLHGSAGANHHPLRTTLGLIHVGPSGGHWGRSLGRNSLWSPHPYWACVSHGHLWALTLLMVRRHHACLSLQSHLPLSIGDLLDSHRNFDSCRWRPRRGLLLGHGSLALRLTWRMLACNVSSHHRGTRLLLGRGYGAKDWFAL